MAEAPHSTFTIGALPESPLEAHGHVMADGLGPVRSALADDCVEALTLILPAAGPDHSDWRRALARDLAREFTPKRVNIAAGEPGEALDTLLNYLEGAPGVTGHYLHTHE